MQLLPRKLVLRSIVMAAAIGSILPACGARIDGSAGVASSEAGGGAGTRAGAGTSTSPTASATSTPPETAPTTSDTRVIVTTGTAIELRTASGDPLQDTTALATGRAGLIAAGSATGDIAVYDGSGMLLEEIPDAHDGSVTGLGFIGKDAQLLSAGKDGNLTVWTHTEDRWARSHSWQPHDGVAVTAMAVTPSSVLTGSGDRTLRRWTSDGALISEHRLAGGITELAAIGPLAIAGLSSGEIVSIDEAGMVKSIASTAAGGDLAAAGDGLLIGGKPQPLWWTGTGEATALTLPPSASGVTSVAAWPSRSDVLIAVAGTDEQGSDPGASTTAAAGPRRGVVRIATVSEPGDALVERGFSDLVTDLAFTADGKRVVVTTRDEARIVPLLAG